MRRAVGFLTASGLAIGVCLAAHPSDALSLLEPALITSEVTGVDGTCCVAATAVVSTVPGSERARATSSPSSSNTRLTFASDVIQVDTAQLRHLTANEAIGSTLSRFTVADDQPYLLRGQWDVSRGDAPGPGMGVEILVSFVDLTTGEILLLDDRILEVTPGGELYSIEPSIGSRLGTLDAGHAYELRTRFAITRAEGTFANATNSSSGIVLLELTPIPEPATGLLMTGALVLLAAQRRSAVA